MFTRFAIVHGRIYDRVLGDFGNFRADGADGLRLRCDKLNAGCTSKINMSWLNKRLKCIESGRDFKFKEYYRTDCTDEHISMLKTRENIQDKLEHLMLNVKSFTDDECLKWSRVLCSGQEIPKKDLYKIILM